MTKEMIQEIGSVMANKMAIVNMNKNNEEWKGNLRKFPIFSELIGMEMTLKIMDVNYEYEFNEDVSEATALVIEGIRFEIA